MAENIETPEENIAVKAFEQVEKRNRRRNIIVITGKVVALVFPIAAVVFVLNRTQDSPESSEEK